MNGRDSAPKVVATTPLLQTGQRPIPERMARVESEVSDQDEMLGKILAELAATRADVAKLRNARAGDIGVVGLIAHELVKQFAHLSTSEPSSLGTLGVVLVAMLYFHRRS